MKEKIRGFGRGAQFFWSGGVHPEDKKDLSQDFPIRDVKPKSKTVFIPLTMGGAPNTACVKEGERVLRGQVIAKSDAFMSAPVHSSVTGTVKKLTNHIVTPNIEAPCAQIISEESDEKLYMEGIDPFTATKDECLSRIREAGITGMGGASFPTHVKLSIPATKSVGCVLINAAECEPYLTCDERLLQEYPDKVVDGLAIICHTVATSKDTKGVIVLEENKAYIFDVLTHMIELYKKEHNNVPFDLTVQLVETKYPQGSEKFIVKATTGREIPSGALPVDAGCVICNVGTACAISDAFRSGKPLIDRVFTVSGEGVDRSGTFRVPIGTILSDLTPELFNIKTSCTKVISGGPMMGFAMSTVDFPIVKGTSGVVFLMGEGDKHKAVLTSEDACIGCARCVDTCPMRLYPVLMLRAIKAGQYNKAQKVGLMDCIECGSCAYSCPANIKIVQRLRLAKAVVRAEAQAAKAKNNANNGGAK